MKSEAKWSLENNANKKVADKIPGALWKIIEEHAIRVLHLICKQMWKTQQ